MLSLFCMLTACLAKALCTISQTKYVSFLLSKVKLCKWYDTEKYVHVAMIWQAATPGLQAHAACDTALTSRLGPSCRCIIAQSTKHVILCTGSLAATT